LLSVAALLMSLWLTWQVSGQAWLTWWQAQEREEDALLQLQSLQQQVDQHQQRVAALQAMRHPSGQDWPAWVSISPNNRDTQLLGSRDWRGSLPRLLVVWQTFVQQSPHARVNAFVVSAVNTQGSVDNTKELNLQLHTQDDAEQALKRFETSSAKLAPAPVRPDGQPPARLFNPFDATGLSQGLPTLEPTARAQAGLPDAELSQWKWVGAITSGNRSLALLTHEGQLFTIKPGQALGAQGGEVTQVGADHLWLQQWVADSHGLWQARSSRWPGKGTP
jgi:Tfp pilus assembly protein PilP